MMRLSVPGHQSAKGKFSSVGNASDVTGRGIDAPHRHAAGLHHALSRRPASGTVTGTATRAGAAYR